MPYFRFEAEQIIEADSKEEAKSIFALVRSCTFGEDADCKELKNDFQDRQSRLFADYELYRIVTQNAQTVAEKELDRKLTEEELAVVEHKLDNYVDLYESLASCICQEL